MTHRERMYKKTRCKWCGETGYTKYRLVDETGGWDYRCTSCFYEEDHDPCRDCGDLYHWVDMKHVTQDKYVYKRWPKLRGRCYRCSIKHMNEVPPIQIAVCNRCTMTYTPDKEDIGLCGTCAKAFDRCPTCNDNYVEKFFNVIAYDIETGNEVEVERECPVCLRHKYSRCQGCGLHLVGDNHNLCPDCKADIITCELCGVMGNKRDFGTIENKRLCPHCINRRVGTCRECGEMKIDVGNKYHHHKPDNPNGCRDCIGSPIMRYNFKPHPQYFGQGVLYYGIENEYDFPTGHFRRYTDMLREQYAKDPLRYFVHDGSLKNGVEMVFHPQTFDHFMDLQDPLPVNVPNTTQLNTNGLHIHMSKAAFTTFHLYKFLNFIAMNADGKFQPIFKRKIGHTSPQNGKIYCEHFPFTVKQIAKARMGNKKYWWINLSNEHTIEIRLFKAAQTSDELRACVQFLDALYYYTKNTSEKSLDYYDYIRFLRSEKHYEQAYNTLMKEVD